MKNLKVLFTVLCVACATAVWGEGSETFEKIENKTSYTANLSWEGVNGLTWKASTFRTDQKITGNRGLTAKASTACTITMPLTTEQQSAGMGTFSFKYKYPYSDSGKSNNLSFTINGKTYTGSVSYSANEQTVEISVNESTLPSSITINIASGGRACFDDFSWTSFSGSTETTKYTVQWMVDGQPYTTGNPTTSVKSGEKVSTLPTDPADNSLSCAEKFMGWSAEHIGTNPQDNAPADLFTTADASPAITENTTFYAVFASPQK